MQKLDQPINDQIKKYDEVRKVMTGKGDDFTTDIRPLDLLGLTAASSAIDAGVQKKIYGSGTTTLIISNKEMNDIMKIVQDLEDRGILLKGVTETIKNETKEQKGVFFYRCCYILACLVCKK